MTGILLCVKVTVSILLQCKMTACRLAVCWNDFRNMHSCRRTVLEGSLKSPWKGGWKSLNSKVELIVLCCVDSVIQYLSTRTASLITCTGYFTLTATMSSSPPPRMYTHRHTQTDRQTDRHRQTDSCILITHEPFRRFAPERLDRRVHCAVKLCLWKVSTFWMLLSSKQV